VRDRDVEGQVPAPRVADEPGPLDLQGVDRGEHVVRVLLDGARAVPRPTAPRRAGCSAAS
jgi:hypothetical protein